METTKSFKSSSFSPIDFTLENEPETNRTGPEARALPAACISAGQRRRKEIEKRERRGSGNS